MYNTAIPKVIGVPTHDNEKLLADLKLCGANRVFLALPVLPYDAEKRQEIFDNLKKDIEFFKGKGVEIGVWFWAFWVQGENPFTPITGPNDGSLNAITVFLYSLLSFLTG